MELLKDEQKNLIFGKYKLTKIIGSGSFGFVYKGINIIDKKGVAVKVEKKDIGLNLLEKESYYLYNLKGIGVPEVVSYGYSGKYNILVQTLLGESLGKIFYKNNYHFPLKDICMFSIQILDRIEYVHSKYIIHRDIKPENFLIGDPDKYMIYIIDFGLSKKYKSSRTNKHVQFRLTKKFTGTARYASLNSIRGSEQSRRDDLEAIGYMLLYFFNGGKLPWQGVSCKQKAEKYVKIYTMKKNLNLDEFCKDMPREIIYFMNYARGLEFEQKPDYNYLRSLFENVLKANRTSNDLHFSWIKDLSILKNCENSVNKISLKNMGKRKVSPQSRIIKQLESSRRESSKKKENGNESKILKMNNSLKNLQNIIILKNPSYNSYNQFIIHKRFNSSGDGQEFRSNKDSENIKSGIAQYNISIDDEQMIDKNTKNKIVDIIGKQNIININPNINKNNNLYYFSNINDLNSNLLNNSKEMTLNESNIKKNNFHQHNQIKKQNSYSFLIHNKVIANPINNSYSNLNITEMKSLNNNYFSPNIVKSFSYIKKTKPKFEVKRDNFNNPKDNSPNTNIYKSQNISFKRNNNIKKIIPNIKINYKNLKINDIKKQITKVSKNKKVNINVNPNKNKINLINVQKNGQNINITEQAKTKKIVTNPAKKTKSRKILKMKVKNLQNISIQDSTNNLNLNYQSAKNILKHNKSQSNLKQNLKRSFIPKNNNNMNNENVINTSNLTNNFSNNFEGKINKLKIMDIHSSMKKIYMNNYKKISTDQLSKENININNNVEILSQSQNQLRNDKYKNIRNIHQNLQIQKSMTKINNDLSKKSLTNGTINTTINNSNTINNTINTNNNNNNTIISIYNNYNLNKKGNKYGFIHKKIDNNNNIALDTLNNIIKGKNIYSSYNGYNVKLNSYNNYINLHSRKNSTLTNRPTLNNLINNNNYNTLNSKNLNDIQSNHHNSQNISNKEYSIQDNNYSKKKMKEYFAIKNLEKESEGNYKKVMNLSSSRPNLNSFRYQNIANELNIMDTSQNINRERNTTKNIISNFIVKKNDVSKDKPYKYSMNINRSNSFLYRPNFMHFGLRKENSMSNLDKFSPTISRKQTEIFYQGLPNFKRNYNIYDSSLINGNNEISPKKYRAQSREYVHNNNNRVKEYDFF